MRDCVAFVERNKSIANLASLVKLLIKLLTDLYTRPRFVNNRPMSPGNYIATSCMDPDNIFRITTGRPKKLAHSCTP